MTLLRSRLARQREIVALRHQIAVYQRSVSRPRLRATNRLFWVWLSRLWSGWQHALAFVQVGAAVDTGDGGGKRFLKTQSCDNEAMPGAAPCWPTLS
jgi:hypothetical protein